MCAVSIFRHAVTEPGFWVVSAAFVVAIIATWGVAKWAKKRQYLAGQTFPVFFSGLGLLIGLPVGLSGYWYADALGISGTQRF